MIDINSDNRDWVFCSTPLSFRDKKISLLAVVETVFAAIVYFYLATKYGTLHITLAVIITPLILTRTNESVHFALYHSKSSTSTAIFGGKNKTPYVKQTLTCLTVLAAGCICMYLFINYFNSDDPVDSLISTIFNLPIISVLMILVVALFALLVYIFLPLCLRVVANLHGIYIDPQKSISNIPSNWWANIAYIDSAHPSEILPGAILYDEANNRVSVLQPYGYILTKNSKTLGKFGKIRTREFILEVGTTLFETISLLVAAIPTILYRWSLKGASLLLAPLIWFVYDASHTRPEYIVKSTFMKSLFKLSLGIVFLYLGLAISYLFEVRILEEVPDGGVLTLLSDIASQEGFFAIKLFSFLTAITTVICYLYSERLDVRGYEKQQLWELKSLLYLIGIFSVFLVFSLIFILASATNN